MDENQTKPENLIDTTDCLEAISVFKGWKNFLFVIAVFCLVLLQISFWLVNTGCVKVDEAKSDLPAVIAGDKEQAKDVVRELAHEPNEPAKTATPEVAEPNQPSEPNEAAKLPAAGSNESTKAGPADVDTNQPTEATPQKAKKALSIRLPIRLKLQHLSFLIRFLDFVLILTASLYCLTMLFNLKVSLVSRLGGINHIARAFFLSLVMLVLLLPWQKFFAGIVAGALYTPQELLASCAAAETRSIFAAILFYLRFVGYWVLVVLLLIFAQLRSARWAKATLRRLGVV